MNKFISLNLRVSQIIEIIKNDINKSEIMLKKTVKVDQTL